MDKVSMGRRFGALLVDWLIALFSSAAITGTAILGSDTSKPFIPLIIFWVEVTIPVGLVGFSIGKRVFGLKVEGRDGRPIGLLKAGLRTALLCLVIPAIVMTEEKRGLHEVASGSREIRS